jgi:hypothetical protein
MNDLLSLNVDVVTAELGYRRSLLTASRSRRIRRPRRAAR